MLCLTLSFLYLPETPIEPLYLSSFLWGIRIRITDIKPWLWFNLIEETRTLRTRYALAQNQSAQDVMGVDKLRDLPIVLCDRIRKNASIDWNLKESVRARMKVAVKRLLRQYGYPPDMEALATELVLEQANVFTEFEVATNH